MERGVIKGYISLRKTAQRRASIDEHHFLQLNLVTRRKRLAQNKLLAKLLDEHMAFTWPELVTLLRRLGYYLTTCQSLGHTPEKPCKAPSMSGSAMTCTWRRPWRRPARN